MAMTTLTVRHDVRIAAMRCLRTHQAHVNADDGVTRGRLPRSVRVVCARSGVTSRRFAAIAWWLHIRNDF